MVIWATNQKWSKLISVQEIKAGDMKEQRREIRGWGGGNCHLNDKRAKKRGGARLRDFYERESQRLLRAASLTLKNQLM